MRQRMATRSGQRSSDEAVRRGLSWRAAGAARPAPSRTQSMDAHLLATERGVLAIADGVSSTPLGGQAAALAVREFCQHARSGDPSVLRAAVRHAQDAVRREYADAERLHGATTLCAVALSAAPDDQDSEEDSADDSDEPGQLAVVQLGDSRCYRLRGRILELLTNDHTVGAHLVAIGAAEPGSALVRRLSNHLERFVGNPAGAEPDITIRDLLPGDRLLLVTDGVYGVVPQPDLAKALADGDSPESIAHSLIEQATANETRDDATAVVAFVSAGVSTSPVIFSEGEIADNGAAKGVVGD